MNAPEQGGSGASKTSLEQLAKRCALALASVLHQPNGVEPDALYLQSVRLLIGMLALFAGSEQVDDSRESASALREAAEALRRASRGEANAVSLFRKTFEQAGKRVGLGVLSSSCAESLSDECVTQLVSSVLAPNADSSIEPLFFQTMPISWLGRLYERMLALKPGGKGGLEADRSRRKAAGAYCTPRWLVDYVVQSSVEILLKSIPGPLAAESVEERVGRLRVLDPSVGSGDFLAGFVVALCRAAADGLEGSGDTKARIAAECVYGVDIDPFAVEIARFAVWAASGFAEGISDALNAHIIQADAVGTSQGEPLNWKSAFADAVGRGAGWGFDAVVGNPPYVASKNGLKAVSRRGQPDSYLLFLSEILKRRLVRRGGVLAMVLPDPFLERANAAEIRRTLVSDWNLVSLLHILGAFAEAGVANVVPVFINSKPRSETFSVARIERAADQRSFAAKPVGFAREISQPVTRSVVLAQDRCELLYLLESGSFREVVRRIHGADLCLTHFEPPFAPLESLNVKTIYRGEEMGKDAIPEDASGLPILLGGQSIRPYEITWEGRRIPESRVAKPRERYARTKILVQKSSSRVVAALDQVRGRHPGYVFPQSVYAIELGSPGMDHYYLLAILNSELMNEYVRRAVTGYKMVQPQLEIENIKALPIRRISFTTPAPRRRMLVEKAVSLFERECSSHSEAAPFSQLGNFVTECLAGGTEMSDVVHDVLVFLARRITRLAAEAGRSSQQGTGTQVEAARSAVETVVWRLYCSESMQLALPL